MVFIPNVYRPPLGLPLYWRDDQSGVLADAIKAYLDERIEGKQMTAEQFDLVRAFLSYYINAPCWSRNLTDDEKSVRLMALRADVRNLKKPDDISGWIRRCLDIGLDPL